MPDFQLELAAARSYADLMALAEECRKAHVRAGVPLPPPLMRLFVEKDSTTRQLSFPLRIRPDEDQQRESSRPPEATADWISLLANEASPTTLTLALLRGQIEPIRAKELADMVTAIRPLTVGVSVYNLLNRLEKEGYAKKQGLMWMMTQKDLGGVLSGKYLWALPRILAKPDLAAHRREAIVSILLSERSLQIMQIIRKLEEWNWVKAPINKDLLKIDMQVLEEQNKVRRIGNSRNWEAVED